MKHARKLRLSLVPFIVMLQNINLSGFIHMFNEILNSDWLLYFMLLLNTQNSRSATITQTRIHKTQDQRQEKLSVKVGFNIFILYTCSPPHPAVAVAVSSRQSFGPQELFIVKFRSRSGPRTMDKDLDLGYTLNLFCTQQTFLGH